MGIESQQSTGVSSTFVVVPSANDKENRMQYLVELEHLLRMYEPTRAYQARELLEAYRGMEKELVQCYRHYYTGAGGFNVANENAPNTKRARTFSLPKPAIGVFLREKLRVRRGNSSAGSKTEGLRGPEAADTTTTARRRAQSLDQNLLRRLQQEEEEEEGDGE